MAEKKVKAETTKAEPKKADAAAPVAKAPKKKVDSGILFVQSTYNNTMCLLTDSKGNALAASSAGALGFKGAKKGDELKISWVDNKGATDTTTAKIQ